MPKKENKRKVGKWLFWTPRIFSILILLFLALFSLDVFDSCNSFFSCLLALFMHNLPVIILLILFIIAWKKEIVGAWTFFLTGLLYLVLCLFRFINSSPREYYMLTWPLIISLPLFIIGYLFWLNYKKKSRTQ
jgi:Na+/proline symporter